MNIHAKLWLKKNNIKWISYTLRVKIFHIHPPPSTLHPARTPPSPPSTLHAPPSTLAPSTLHLPPPSTRHPARTPPSTLPLTLPPSIHPFQPPPSTCAPPSIPNLYRLDRPLPPMLATPFPPLPPPSPPPSPSPPAPLHPPPSPSLFLINIHPLLGPPPDVVSFRGRGKTRLAGIAGKFQSWTKTIICWPRSTVSKGDVGSCDSHLTEGVSLFQAKSRCELTQLTSKRCVTRVTKGDVMLCDSQFLAKPLWHCAMSKATYHRMPVEDLEVVKCCKLGGEGCERVEGVKEGVEGGGWRACMVEGV